MWQRQRKRRLDRAIRPRLEALDGRVLLSTVTAALESGVLRVIGTSGRDRISIDNYSDIVVVLSGSNTTIARFNRSQVTTLSIDTGGDDDWVYIDDNHGSRPINSTIRLGSGNDYAHGGAGDDTIDGGPGEFQDHLLGQSGNDTLIGGDGDDRLDGGQGTDTVDGGNGSDLLQDVWDELSDAITGGSGRDTFHILIPSGATEVQAKSQVKDWSVTDGDVFVHNFMMMIREPPHSTLTAPSPPENLTSSNLSATQVDLKWDDRSDNEAGFKVIASSNNGASWQDVAITGDDQTTARVTGLTPATTYLFSVQSFNNGGYSGWTSLRVTTSAVVSPPANLRADSVAPTQVDLRWDDRSNNETGFKVIASSNNGASWQEVAITGANQTTARAAGLTPATTYVFNVQSFNNGVYSEWTTLWVTTPSVIPAAPANVRVDAVAPAQATLRWDDRSNNETGFRVIRSSNGGANWDEAAVVGANQTSVQMTGLTPGTTYLVAVQAQKADSGSDWSFVWMTTPAAITVSPPANLRTESLTPTAATLRWDDRSNNETGFRVIRSSNGGANWDEAAVVGANQTSVQMTGLTPGTTYLVAVQAQNADSGSDWSFVWMTTPAAITVTAPANLRYERLSSSALTLRWDDLSNNETGFRVIRSTNGGASWEEVAVVGANQRSWRVTGLKRATAYTFAVQALGVNGASDWIFLNVKTRK